MTILDEAARLTSSERQAVYGHPLLHFTCTAAQVTAILIRLGWTPPKDPGCLTAAGWMLLIQADKQSRQAGSLAATGELHRDTLVDVAGYARTGEMLTEMPEA